VVAAAARRETQGETHLETLTALNNLGSAHFAAGDLEAAEELYRECLRRATARDAERAWDAVMAHQPVDLLRAALLRTAPSPEGFLAVRARCLRSLAAISVAGYVVGIGDRHLDNFLFDRSDGGLVPIDFGATFGAGASALQVPELIPFRLSPNLAALAAPLPTPQLLHALMAHALRALQGEAARRSLLAVSDAP
jgi:DNA-dependent protein kinase catalytic subunit